MTDSGTFLYAIRNATYNEVVNAAWTGSTLYSGTTVVYESKYGMDIGVVISIVNRNPEYVQGCDRVLGANPEQRVKKEYKSVESADGFPVIHRIATPKDMAEYNKNSDKENYALQICKQKVAMRNLPMNVVGAHFLLGGSKVIFFFVADERVDFRELVKDLAGIFKTRIDLRQITPRDGAMFVGGISICGRVFCCRANGLSPETVGLAMVREQGMLASVDKLSGPCGRIVCCMAYENDTYMKEKSECPKEGSEIFIKNEKWTVSSVNILTRKITMESAERAKTEVPFEGFFRENDHSRWKISKNYIDLLFT